MSKKDPWYRQCRYEVETAAGHKKTDTSWIPETLAKVGKKIYFGTKASTSEELKEREMWIVVSVGNRKPESWLVLHSMDYKHQRKMSDV